MLTLFLVSCFLFMLLRENVVLVYVFKGFL